MVNTDFVQTDTANDNAAEAGPYRTFGLGLTAQPQARVSIRREHR